ncbi:MAG TPA: TonB-dependent receptor [Terriglobales bacterium]|nr:TonB-dependent receptor [Terriglobales bacterium]
MRSLRFALLMVVSISLSPTLVRAQSATATILGHVTDPQGAAVAKARVTATNTATQVAYKTTSDGEGNYRVPALPIGTYIVSAEHEGFSKLVTEARSLQINQEMRMDLRLTVGAKTETVEVTDVGSNVETVNPTIGASVTSRPIVNMPLNGRDVLDLALLQPGVSESNPDDGSAGHFNIGGGRADSVTFLLDGGINNDLMGNEVVLDPNPDTIEEFRILTSNYGAEYGRNGGGIISAVIKSGTNQFHGSAFDFVRNTAFDANSYFNKDPFLNPDPLPRNNLKRHQFGGTIGGPITIPHLLNGKDRFFFFVSYQGQRQSLDVVQSTTAFTTDELNNGDFSQSPNADSIAAFLTANPYFQPDPNLAAQAIIDPTRFDPAAQAYIATGLVPSTQNLNNVLVSQGGQTSNNNELTVKLDFNLAARDKVSVTLGGYRSSSIDPFAQAENTVTGFPAESISNNYFLNIGYTHTFSPTLLNEFHAVAQRHNDTHDLPTTKLPTGADLGFGIVSDLENGPPSMYFDNGLAFGTDPQGPAFLRGNTFAFTDALTWVKGRHTWKVGAGFSAYQNNTTYDFYGIGQFEFVGPYDAGGIGSGDSLADFLLGLPNNFYEGANASNNVRSKAVYGFAQDEWHVTKNLTLTLGLRYEYSTPKLDTEGRSFSIIPGGQSTRFPNAPLGLLFPGDKGAPRGVNFPVKDNFAPRFGFAWDPTGKGKMSIRGGIGVFYDVLKAEDNLQFNGVPPYYSEQYAAYDPQKKAYKKKGAPYYSEPWTTAGFPQNPFPSVPPTPESAFNTDPSSPYFGNSLYFGGLGTYFVDPHLHTPYTYQYNVSVERELVRNLVAEFSYVGSSAKKLTSLIDVNPFVLSTVGTDNPTRVLNALQPNTSLTDFCSGYFDGQSDCPFANADAFGNVSFASFNSLEASLTKDNGKNRYIGNTYFTLGYTYAHSIDNASGFRNRSSQVPAYNPGVFRASSDFDLTHRITFSGGWDLPFDEAWAEGPKRLTNGWSLYPILTWRTGFPLTISSQLVDSFDPSDPGPSGAGDSYLANAVFNTGYNSISIKNPHSISSCNNPNFGAEQGNVYFDCAAFVPISDVPGSGYGLPRNFFRGPHRVNFDLAVAKTTPITERVRSELRLEAFNVFNHAEFANPDTNIFSPTFGQVTDTDLATPGAGYHTERILQLALRLTF